ncbi:hypothetical protein FAGKG844_1000002 [Frankia sp. AgKG'84/4]
MPLTRGPLATTCADDGAASNMRLLIEQVATWPLRTVGSLWVRMFRHGAAPGDTLRH